MVANPEDLQNMLEQAGLGSGNNNGMGNGFGIPDLSQGFPGLGISSLDDLNSIGGGIDQPSLVGKGVQGDPSGKFKFLNPSKLEKMAVQADQLGYNLSDEDWAKRFPWLAKGRDYAVESARSNLAGERDPFLTNTLKQAGLGDVDFGTGEFKQARNMGQPILQKEQRDRAYFQRLMADNPQRAFGLNAGDIARIAMANTNGVNMNALGLATGRANQAISNINSQAQDNAAMISAFSKIGSTAIGAFANKTNYTSPTLQPGYYNAPGYAVPQGTYSGAGLGWGDYGSGNYYDASGNYLGNTYTGEGG